MVRASIPPHAPPGHRWAHHPWVQGFFGLVFTLLGVTMLVSAPTRFAGGEEVLAEGRTCTPGETVDCLQAVPGRIDDRRGRAWSPRWHFVPSAPGAEDRWVRFDGDEEEDGSPAMRSILSGDQVVALYVEDDLVAFDALGERVPLDAPGNWRGMFWIGLFFLGLGVGMLGYAWYRRDRPVEVGGAAVGRARMPVWGQVSLVLGLAGIVPAFLGSVSTQLVAYAIVAVPLLLLVALARRRGA